MGCPRSVWVGTGGYRSVAGSGETLSPLQELEGGEHREPSF